MNQTASRNSSESSPPDGPQSGAQKSSRKTLQKYIVMQIPGATMVAFLLVALYYMGTLSGGLAALMMVGWCAKDAVMYRFVRSAYEPGPLHGTDALIGRPAVVVEACAPEGRIRIGAEHWVARPQAEGQSFAAGDAVRVVAAVGYTLQVEAIDGGTRQG